MSVRASICLIALITLAAASAYAADSATSGRLDDPVNRCHALTSADLSDLQDAPTKITQARWVEAQGDDPAYCEVQGYVSPNINVEMRLPGRTWNGKFMKAGCGGFCGNASAMMESICSGGVRKGYACITSDMGHRSTSQDGIWAYNNLQAKLDWGVRAVHVVTLAGKAIVNRYFNAPPAKSYFYGCSTGGRQGLVAAQRFPWDFDGIVAGAPPIEHTRNNVAVLWNHRAVLDENGRSVLTPADAELVHQAVLAKCDGIDGLKDGILEDPRLCKFDPAELSCKAGKSESCLTPKQVEAVKKLYSGPVTFPNEFSSAGKLLPGSERHWSPMYFTEDGGPGTSLPYQSDKQRFTAFMPDAGPDWKVTDLDFANDPKRYGVMESLYAANNPDLRKLKKAGAKLLLFQGWADYGDFPEAVTDYYETVERTMGGRAATQDFFRLFVVPGMGHCTGGDGAYVVDYFSALEAWVEKGQAPDKLIGAHPDESEGPYPARLLETGLPPKVKFTRPIYPYPIRAKYSGRGDPNDAASFVPVMP